jgi:hypothetical protein
LWQWPEVQEVLRQMIASNNSYSSKQHHISDSPVERFSGPVERVTFHSEESGFCVLRVKVKGQLELVTVIGSAASITPGEYVECVGIWHNDRTHGLQYTASHLKVVPPSTLEGIEKYLGFGMARLPHPLPQRLRILCPCRRTLPEVPLERAHHPEHS